MQHRPWSKAILIPLLALIGSACNSTGTAPSSTGLATAIPSLAAVPSASAEASPSASALAGKLVVWDWQVGTPNGKGFDQIDAEFKKLYPQIDLQHVGQPVAQWDTLVRQAFSSQTGPDAIFNDGSPSKLIQYKDLLQPLNDRVTPAIHDSLFGWDIVSSQVDSSGTIFGLPYNVDGVGFFYNRDLFTKAGLDPTKPPQTLAELLDACTALKAAGVVPVGGGGNGSLADATVRALWSGGLTQTETSALAAKTLKWTDPKVAAIFQANLDMWKKGCFDPKWAGIDPNTDGLTQWKTGKVAIMPYFLGYTPALNSGAANTGVFVVGLDSPGPKYLQFGASVAWSITKWSTVKDLAWAYINFVTSKQGEQIRYESDNIAPTNLGVDISKAGADYQYFYTLAKTLPSSTLATSYYSPGIIPAMAPNIVSLLTGKQTLVQTMAAFQAIQDGAP